MLTEASQEALDGLRDLTTVKWYVIPLLAIVFYIYTKEIKRARHRKNWNAVLAGLTIFGVDFFNETWNGWVFYLTQYSAVWTVPGETALRTMVGWNIEIMFMFSLAGIIYYHSLFRSRRTKIIGVPNRWFWALAYAAFCVFVECLLNIGGHLVWVYPWWNYSLTGVWLIFLLGYFPFFLAAMIVINMRSLRKKIITVAVIYTVPILMNIFAFGILGWNY